MVQVIDSSLLISILPLSLPIASGKYKANLFFHSSSLSTNDPFEIKCSLTSFFGGGKMSQNKLIFLLVTSRQHNEDQKNLYMMGNLVPVEL